MTVQRQAALARRGGQAVAQPLVRGCEPGWFRSLLEVMGSLPWGNMIRAGQTTTFIISIFLYTCIYIYKHL